MPPPEVTALAITHNAATELTDGLAGFLGGDPRLTVPYSLRPDSSGLCPLEGKTAEIAHLHSVVPMRGLGPPAAGQVVVQMAGNRAIGGGGAFVFGLRRADSSWSNSSLEATAGGTDLHPQHESPYNLGRHMVLPADSPRCTHQSAVRRGVFPACQPAPGSISFGVACDLHLLEETLAAGHNVHGGRHLL